MAAPASREAPALWAQRAGQGLYIVPDHCNVSGRIALFAGQAVRIERSADPGAGLGRDPAHQAGVGDVFEEYRWYPGRPDLGDDPRDIAGAGLGFGRDAERGDEFDAIGGGEIAEGIMGRDHLAAAFR